MDKDTARRFDSLEKSIHILRDSLSSDTLKDEPKKRNRMYIGRYTDELANILLKEKFVGFKGFKIEYLDDPIIY
jgi:hypothetical protein